MFYIYVAQNMLAWPCAEGSHATLQEAKDEAASQLDAHHENGWELEDGGTEPANPWETAWISTHVNGKFVKVAEKKYGGDWVDLEIA